MTILSHVCLIIRGRQLTTIEHGAENQFAVDSFAKLRNMGLSPNTVQFDLTRVILFAISALPTEVNVTRWRWYTNQAPSRPPAPAKQRPRNDVITTVLHGCCGSWRGRGQYRKPLTQLGVMVPQENTSQLVYLASPVPPAPPQQVET
jgi:hypothetical protein